MEDYLDNPKNNSKRKAVVLVDYSEGFSEVGPNSKKAVNNHNLYNLVIMKSVV